MTGYSDRINHAFAFAAKHYGSTAPSGVGMNYLAHPSNVAVILAGYGADEETIVAGILHHVLVAAAADQRPDLERKIRTKFGPVVLGITLAAACQPVANGLTPWREAREQWLAHLAAAERRVLDICVAAEIHRCGSAITAVRRLGAEYARGSVGSTSAETIWWCRSLLDMLGARTDWARGDMLAELRQLSAALVKGLREAEG
ncbi:MAG TPA: HD domain-containing protein [Gemmatimonadales bacterium]|nr:HD domain-containing protein [Gemmatimonadales bacterium]